VSTPCIKLKGDARRVMEECLRLTLKHSNGCTRPCLAHLDRRRRENRDAIAVSGKQLAFAGHGMRWLTN
jgi:hypothetical protein